MKKHRNKKIVSVMLMLSMLFGVCMVATAAGTPAATRSSLYSQGAVSYRNGTESVVIDSADLYTLADRLDLFKVRTVEQLGVIGTYLSDNLEGKPLTSEADINALHQKPPTGSETDPRSLSFDMIVKGIAKSQSIPTDPTDYGMEAGTTLYLGKDGKLYSSKQEGADEIHIRRATAENLSAGTAAWVDGHLILGTGDDNKAYHDLGYQEGADDRGGSGDDRPGGSGDDDPGTSGDVNKARVINMNNGSDSYVVQEDMTDVFLCFSHVDSRTTPVLNPGESIKHVIRNTPPGTPYYTWDMYYIPKLTKGTVISNLVASNSANNMNMLITIEGSNKGGKVNGIIAGKDYVVEEDLTDVFYYTSSSKSKMPDFVPMDDQEYVSFKLLKDVSYHYDDGNLGNIACGCLYYIPELKAGTKISGTSGYLVY